MRRRLFDALCLLSLACALAVAALGVRSVVWASDTLSVGLPASLTWFSVSSTHAALGATIQVLPSRPGSDRWEWAYRQYPPTAPYYGPPRFSLYGLPRPVVPGSGFDIWFFTPAWLALLACLVLPLTRLVLARRARRARAARLCSRCGYDLRATPGPTCPECGQPTPAPAPTRPPQPQPRPSEPAASAGV